MSSSEGARKWVTRWKYVMTAKALRPGIWGLKDGGFFLRTRVLDPRSGKFVEYQRVLRDVTLSQVEQAKFRLRSDAQDLASGRKQLPTLWSSYAASLFEAKVNEGRIGDSRGGRIAWRLADSQPPGARRGDRRRGRGRGEGPRAATAVRDSLHRSVGGAVRRPVSRVRIALSW